MENRRLTKECYQFSKQLDENGRNTWSTKVKILLSKYGFADVWLYQGVANVDLFLNTFKQRIRDCYLQDWQNSIINSGKLALYRNIKCSISQAPYLGIFREKKYRSIMAKFRCNNHQLVIETGRHNPNHIDQDDRICIYCLRHYNVRIVENEYHFLLKCPLYDDIRKRYIVDMLSKYNINNDRVTAILLGSKDISVINSVGLYLYHSFSARKNIYLLEPCLEAAVKGTKTILYPS
jgi:hypothetical protein